MVNWIGDHNRIPNGFRQKRGTIESLAGLRPHIDYERQKKNLPIKIRRLQHLDPLLEQKIIRFLICESTEKAAGQAQPAQFPPKLFPG